MRSILGNIIEFALVGEDDRDVCVASSVANCLDYIPERPEGEMDKKQKQNIVQFLK